MSEIFNNLEEELIIQSDIASLLHASFVQLQLSISRNVQKNSNCLPSVRRYADDIKEFALILYFYLQKAYEYVRSILPLANPSLSGSGQARLSVN